MPSWDSGRGLQLYFKGISYFICVWLFKFLKLALSATLQLSALFFHLKLSEAALWDGTMAFQARKFRMLPSYAACIDACQAHFGMQRVPPCLCSRLLSLHSNVKARAPQAHTLLEVVRARWGYTAHKVFFFFAITTNVIVTAMELLGSASVLNALTGVNRNAACMLIPVGVIIKTITGGLSQTYISSLLGSWIIMIVVLVFAFRVYANGDDGLLLGSPAAVWNNLNTYASTPAPRKPQPRSQ